MSIKRDALQILHWLYSDKVQRVEPEIDAIFHGLSISQTRFLNALEYLEERGLIYKRRLSKGETGGSKSKAKEFRISASGIDAIEDDDVFKENFGALKYNVNQQGKINILNQPGNKSSTNINATNVDRTSHKNTRDVIYGNVTQNISDGTITYEGDIRDNFFIEKSSIFLINFLGERKVKYIGLITTIVGIIDVIAWVVSITNDIIPMTYNKYTFYVVGFGFLLVIFGLLFLKLLTYKIERKCPKCNKDYAMEEYRDPDVKEVETSEGLRKKTTRYYKCKYCGNEDTIIEKDLIPYEE